MKRKKNGFTLIEVLVVIIIVSLIVFLVFPNMLKTIRSIESRTFLSKVAIIEEAAKLYGSDNSSKFNDVEDQFQISIGELLAQDYIKPDAENGVNGCSSEYGCVINPDKKESMNDECVIITKKGSTYNAEYTTGTCKKGPYEVIIKTDGHARIRKTDNLEYKDTLTYVTYEGESITFEYDAVGYTYSNNVNCNGTISSKASGKKITISEIQKDLICTPRFDLSTYTVTLNGNGATTAGSNSAMATYYATTLSAITLPQRKYTVSFNSNSSGATISSTSQLTSTYTFNGWYTAASGGSKVASNAATPALVASVSGYTDSSKRWTKTGTATLYAQWTGKAVTLPTVTKTGYTCAWYTAASGGSKVGNNNGGGSYTPTSTLTLHARCTANSYTLYLDANGGTLQPTSGWDTPITNGYTKWSISKSVTFNSAYPSMPTPTKTGYTFANWTNIYTYGNKTLAATTSNYNHFSVYNNNVIPGVTYNITMTSASVTSGSASQFVTLCYDYTDKKNLASATANFGSNVSYNITCPSTADRTHELALIIYSGINGQTANIATQFNGIKINTTATSTATNYSSSNKVVTPRNHELFATYNPNIYMVTLDSQSATNAGTKTIYEKYNTGYYTNITATTQMTTSVNGITKPTKTGYTFGGYYTSTNGSGIQYIDANGKLTSSASVTNFTNNNGKLYAKWTEKTAILSYDANGHGTAPSSVTMKYTAETKAAAAITATGYTFSKWCTNSNGTGSCYNANAQVKAANIEPSTTKLYAIWTISSYTVTASSTNTNYGTVSPATQKVNKGSNAKITISPKMGYMYSNNDCGATINDNTLTISNVTSNKTCKVTFKSNITNFPYTGIEQSYIVSQTGYYKLETWGAQGGGAQGTGSSYSTSVEGGYGGYSTGIVYLTQGTTLYINVGGQGSTVIAGAKLAVGGYNGGGSATGYQGTVGSGGGATHIALSSGLLSTLNNKINDILIVSGGGGGVYSGGMYQTREIGHAGGYIGNKSCGPYFSNGQQCASGGTQTTGGGFGFGSNSYPTNHEDNGGAGGGYYGGNTYYYSAGGGSGYIGNSNLTTKHMTCYNCITSTATDTKTNSTTNVSETPTADYAKKGDGFVRITKQ